MPPASGARSLNLRTAGKSLALVLNELINFGCAGSLLLHGLFLAATSSSHSLVVVCGLLTAVAHLAAEHRLCDERASVVAAPGL